MWDIVRIDTSTGTRVETLVDTVEDQVEALSLAEWRTHASPKRSVRYVAREIQEVDS